jgi:hypothetical protein
MQDTKSSACAQAFGTPELLEAILAQLPGKDLLLAQRISHRFETAIKSSPSLQQKLFFRAVPLEVRKEWAISSLLRHHFLPFFTLPSDPQDIETIELMDWTNDEKRREAFLFKDASWRKMLVIQPPPKRLSVVEFCHGQGGDNARNADIQFEDSQGVTMDAVYDVTIAFLRKNEVSNFGLSILDSEAGPEITLCLQYTMQCCIRVDDYDSKVDLQSKGATGDAHSKLRLTYEQEDGEGEFFSARRLSMDWTTDLTPERGGVNSYDFREWQRDRAPISSILSDVR